MKYCVYILLLEHKRLYVGQTKLWRIHTRWEEHFDPSCSTTQWTNKYAPIEKLQVFECASYRDSMKLEHQVVELLMSIYGLDVVRGGNWNMATEGESWWVPTRLRRVPRFTEKWLSLSAHKFAGCVLNDLAHAGVPGLEEYYSHWRLSLEPELDELPPTSPAWLWSGESTA